MKIYVVLLLVSMAWSLEAKQPSACSCLQDAECLGMDFNKLKLQDITQDLTKLLDNYSNATNTTEDITGEGDVSNCLKDIENLKDQMVKLEKMYDLITANFQWWNDEEEKEETEDAHHWQVDTQKKPVDCADIQVQCNSGSSGGVYTIYPYQNDTWTNVLCDFESDGGGWTVFFTRQPHDHPVDFNESWENFKKGFGNVNTEYWLGNDLIHALTCSGPSMMRVDVENFKGETKWAQWNSFSVAEEAKKYQLTLEQYNNRSTMPDNFSINNKMFFSTIDADNDAQSIEACVTGPNGQRIWGRGGWWYNDCGHARPTAPLKDTGRHSSAWLEKWSMNRYERWKATSVKILSMKFRRHNYEQLATI